MAVSKRSSLGVLNDSASDREVPGSVRLLRHDNGPSDLEHLKRGSNGIILEPQPDDEKSDPLNWPTWRRELALFVIGLYSLIGGGQSPILAAGFNDVADTFQVSIAHVALTTGIYVLGLAIGVVVVAPFATIYGKRPLFLAGAIIFCVTSAWAAASPSYTNLIISRLIMGIGVSPCECLPSAYISEIFFLHERGFKLGIYTLLLLGGKNLVPLVSGVIIQYCGWRWVFWVTAILIGCLIFLIFLFVPEAYWVRGIQIHQESTTSIDTEKPKENEINQEKETIENVETESIEADSKVKHDILEKEGDIEGDGSSASTAAQTPTPDKAQNADPDLEASPIPFNRPDDRSRDISKVPYSDSTPRLENSKATDSPSQHPLNLKFTRHRSNTSFRSQLSVYNGRLRSDSYWKALFRPMVLLTYPAVLWATILYSLSVLWLIIMSETVAHIYQHNPYNFNRLQTGLVYASPFVGGILGAAPGGKLSDIIAKFMAKKNHGLYEPEFRLVMGTLASVVTSIGLMGFGWSAYDGERWIVPTIFFGVISFGSSLGGATAITFAVDSYKQYATEALVIMNFSKSIMVLIFSAFWNDWLDAAGPRVCFLALGGMHLFCLVSIIPMYIYGKRARAWTARQNFMRRFS